MTLGGFDIPGITSSQAAAGAAVLALAISIVTWLSTRKTAKDAVAEAKRAADAAVKSEAHALRSADAAEAAAAIDRAGRHDGRRPTHPGTIKAYWKTGGPTPAAFGTITFGFDYQVRARGIYRAGGYTDLFGPELIRAGMPKEFHLQTVPDMQEPLSMATVEFQFWPPAGIVGADEWACQCGRTEGELDGHWHFQVPIESPIEQLAAEEWTRHLVRYPRHRKRDATGSIGWTCRGDGARPCGARFPLPS